MAATVWDTKIPILTSVRDEVDSVLMDFVEERERTTFGPEAAPLFATVRQLLFANGKRLRPMLCMAGWQAGGAPGDPQVALRAAAALELFQTFALVHDDVMDDSDSRRGRPAAHRSLSAAYLAGGGRSRRARAHGVAAAVLLGDLLLVWSDEMLAGAGLGADQWARVTPLVDSMRNELVYGQYLDLLSADRLSADVEAALRVARYKTGRYTVERPLHIGLALAGADPGLMRTFTDFALPLGEAFQLRDDLLGVFGDPVRTGKPVGDDIREGKATVLLALAVRNASTAELRVLDDLVGRADLDADDVERVRVIMETSGARLRVEEMIATRRDTALALLRGADLPTDVAETLRQMVLLATERTS